MACKKKAAGLRVTQATAQSGAGTAFRIRGQTSINASNDPLIIADGFPIAKSASTGKEVKGVKGLTP